MKGLNMKSRWFVIKKKMYGLGLFLVLLAGTSCLQAAASQESIKEVWELKNLVEPLMALGGGDLKKALLLSPELGLIVTSNGEIEDWITRVKPAKPLVAVGPKEGSSKRGLPVEEVVYEDVRSDLAKLFFKYQDDEVRCSAIPNSPIKTVTPAIVAEWVKMIQAKGIEGFAAEIGMMKDIQDKKKEIAAAEKIISSLEKRKKDKGAIDAQAEKTLADNQKNKLVLDQDLAKLQDNLHTNTLFQEWDVVSGSQDVKTQGKIQEKYDQFVVALRLLVKTDHTKDHAKAHDHTKDHAKAHEDVLKMLMGHVYLKAVEESGLHSKYALSNYFHGMGPAFKPAYYQKADRSGILKRLYSEKLGETVFSLQDLIFYLKSLPTSNFSFLKMQPTLKIDYEADKAIPLCVESTIRSLVNVMLYNPDTKKLDLALMPDSVRDVLLPAFVTFVECWSDNRTSDWYGQTALYEWMDLVSNIPGVGYTRKAQKDGQEVRYELDGDATNILKVLNYLFGLKASNYQELAIALSGAQINRITFIGINDPSKIIVSMGLDEIIGMLSMSFSHAEFNFPRGGVLVILNDDCIDAISKVGEVSGQNIIGMVLNKKTLNQVGSNGLLPLEEAVRANDKELFSLLLFWGASVTGYDSFGDTPLAYLIRKWTSLASVDLLSTREKQWNHFIIKFIAALEPVDIQNSISQEEIQRKKELALSYWSGLLAAIQIQNANLVEMLLEKGVDIPTDIEFDRKSLSFLIQKVTTSESDIWNQFVMRVVPKLISVSLDSYESHAYSEALIQVIKIKNIELAKILIAKGAFVDRSVAGAPSALSLLISNAAIDDTWMLVVIDAVKSLEQASPDSPKANLYGEALIQVIKIKNIKLSEMLIKKGAFLLESVWGAPSALSLLISNAAIDDKTWMPVAIDAVNALEQASPHSRKCSLYGDALIQVIKINKPELAKMLIQKGASLLQGAWDVHSALSLLISNAAIDDKTWMPVAIDAVKSLEQASPNSHKANLYSEVLAEAIKINKPELEKLLIGKGAQA